MRTLLVRAGVAASLAVLAAACGGDSEETAAEQPAAIGQASAAEADGDAPPPTIVVTTSIWADIVGNVACGGLAAVETLIPVGGDPHSFEPSLRDRERLGEAALVVANGLLLEETLEDTLDAVADDGVPVVLMADFVTTIEFAQGERGDDDEGEAHEDEGKEEGTDEDHGHGGDDPHIWFDPTRVAGALAPLGDVLVAEAGLDRGAVDACVATYAAELEVLDSDIEQLLAVVPPDRRTLVTNHEALGYFADRYGFELLGAVIPSPTTLAETSAAALAELAGIIAAEGVPAIFAESQHSSDDAEALAAQVGEVEVVTLFTDSLGEDGSGAETYVGLMRTDAELIATALGG
jgi:zinc/manganese transport system substrate-binding protein